MLCAIGYDEPKWVGALWEAVNGAYQLVVGAVKDTAIAAWESVAETIGGIDFIEQWGNFKDLASSVAAKARGAVLESDYYQYSSNAVIAASDDINSAYDTVVTDVTEAWSAVDSGWDDFQTAVTDVFSGRRRRRWFGSR